MTKRRILDTILEMSTLFGNKGEDAAVEFLKKQGYSILERNFRIRGGEIDIICTDKKILVFVEVKTRTNMAFGSALEAINFQKLRFLVKAAQVYKLAHPQLPDEMRFDAIEIYFQKGKTEINHIKNITM